MFRFRPALLVPQPRFADAATDGVWPLPTAEPATNGGLTSRAALARLPPSLITAELLAAVTLIRREVVSAMIPALDFTSLRGVVAHSLCQARRRGFRNVVVNRVVGAPGGRRGPAPGALSRRIPCDGGERAAVAMPAGAIAGRCLPQSRRAAASAAQLPRPHQAA